LEFGAAVQHGLEPGLVVLGEGVWAAGEPAGDVPDGRRCLGQRFLGGPALVEVAADDGVAAGVATLADLSEQLGAVAAALAGALVQVGLERVQLAGPWSLSAPVG